MGGTDRPSVGSAWGLSTGMGMGASSVDRLNAHPTVGDSDNIRMGDQQAGEGTSGVEGFGDRVTGQHRDHGGRSSGSDQFGSHSRQSQPYGGSGSDSPSASGWSTQPSQRSTGFSSLFGNSSQRDRNKDRSGQRGEMDNSRDMGSQRSFR